MVAVLQKLLVAQNSSTRTVCNHKGNIFLLLRDLEKLILTNPTPGLESCTDRKAGTETLDHGHKRKLKAELGLGFLHRCLQASSWHVFDRSSAARVCTHTTYPPPRAMEIRRGQVMNFTAGGAVELRHGFGRSTDLLWYVVLVLLHDA